MPVERIVHNSYWGCAGNARAYISEQRFSQRYLVTSLLYVGPSLTPEELMIAWSMIVVPAHGRRFGQGRSVRFGHRICPYGFSTGEY
jgi:hypothetical protein